MAVLKILIIGLFVFVVPVLLGISVTDYLGEKYKNSLAASVTIGTMMMFALFQLVAVPVIILNGKFSYVLWIWCIITGFVSLCSLAVNRNKFRPMLKFTSEHVKTAGILGIIAAVIVIFQAGYLALNLHYDDDDARYIPTIVSALEKDTLFFDNPITGEPMYWDISETAKDMVSPWIIFWGVLSRLCMIHPAIVCHTIVPMLYICIAYLMYVLIGRELFDNDSRKTSMFVILVSILNIFSGYSVYNGGAFLLLRIWQGKALFAGMVIPFLFWIAIRFLKSEFTKKECIIPFIACMAASMTTGFGIFLAPMFLFICIIIHGIKHDRWDLYVRMVLGMLPNVIYALIYVYGDKLLI